MYYHESILFKDSVTGSYILRNKADKYSDDNKGFIL